MACFEWISQRALPARFDLRQRGWRLGRSSCEAAGCAVLIDGEKGPSEEPGLAAHRAALAVDVGSSAERATWLRLGLADALPPDSDLDEVEERARRAIGTRPTVRRLGPLTLDLMQRDALVDGRRLRLNGREFALIWRLAQEPGQSVPRHVLLRDVLGLGHEPETNALAVHVCRLRKKLHVARLSHLLRTSEGDRGYALAKAPPRSPQIALDDRGFSSEEEDEALFQEAAE